MIRWSEPVYWRTEQERFRTYYRFWYDETFLNARHGMLEKENDGRPQSFHGDGFVLRPKAKLYLW
jgi:hypothetical protein